MLLQPTVAKRCLSAAALICLIALVGVPGASSSWPTPLDLLRQPQMYLPPDFDTATPEFERIGDQRHVLLFSKTNGYRRHRSIAAAQRMLEQIAADSSWFVYSTENAAIFSADTLMRFDSVVFNNVSGPLLTEKQQRVLTAFVTGGGGVLSLHEQPSGADFRKRFTERIRRASALDRGLPAEPKTPAARRSPQPAPVSPTPAPQP